ARPGRARATAHADDLGARALRLRARHRAARDPARVSRPPRLDHRNRRRDEPPPPYGRLPADASAGGLGPLALRVRRPRALEPRPEGPPDPRSRRATFAARRL